jgi:hypothetical protein
VGPRTGLDAVCKRKLPSSCRESNPDHPDLPARSLVSILTELLRLNDLCLDRRIILEWALEE